MPIGEEPSKVEGLSRFCSEGGVLFWWDISSIASSSTSRKISPGDRGSKDQQETYQRSY